MEWLMEKYAVVLTMMVMLRVGVLLVEATVTISSSPADRQVAQVSTVSFYFERTPTIHSESTFERQSPIYSAR